jgi:winged helix DNA-binding protein
VPAPSIARRRMHASRLTGEPFAGAVEVVRHHLAMQAQEFGPAKWSIGQRSDGVLDPDVDRAVEDGSIVRTHILRPTWHFVAREDLRWLMALSGPRVARGNAGRYRRLGLDAKSFDRAATLIVRELDGGARRTRDQLAEALDRAGFDREGQRMPHILMQLELDLVIGSGGLDGKRQTYILLDGRVPSAELIDRDEALVELVRRYLGSHGPSTVKDMGWWSGLTMGDLRRGLEALGDEVRSEEVDGFSCWSLSAAESRPPAPRGAQLLQTYDELVVGYTESRFAGDPSSELARGAWMERSFPTGLLLLGDRVGGHWRRTFERDGVRIEAHLYEEPTSATTKAVSAVARRFGRFVGITPSIEQSRYAASKGR